MAEFTINLQTTGSAQIEAALKKIALLTEQSSKGSLELAKALNISAAKATDLAKSFGKTPEEISKIVARSKELKEVGFSSAESFAVLNKEMGLTKEQFETLTKESATFAKALEKQTRQQKESSEAQILAMENINASASAVAETMGNLVGMITEAFIEYEDALVNLSAKSGKTLDELGDLIAVIDEVGQKTSQSPAGAARAASALVTLGASAEEAAGSLLTVANLTDAMRDSGAEIEDAAKVIQLGTSIFGDFGETAESVGDKIALIGDLSAVGSLDEFLQLFSKAGPLSKELGVGLDELLASFAALRDAGQAPEVGATSMASLLGTIIESKDELSALGVEIYDATGQFVGMTEVFKRLGTTNLAEVFNLDESGVAEVLALTNEELQALADTAPEVGTSLEEVNSVFGKIGLASALTLTKSFGDVTTKTDVLGNHAEALSAKMEIANSSIQAQINLMQGSFEAALVELGETLTSTFVPGISAINGLLNAFLNAPQVFKTFVGGLIGVGFVLASAAVAITGLGLALKAWEVAQGGATVATIKDTAARVVNAGAAATQQKFLVRDIVLQGQRKAATTAATAATASGTAATATGTAITGAAAASFAVLAAAVAGAVASLVLVAKVWGEVTGVAGNTRDATKDAQKALEEYGVETDKTTEKLNLLQKAAELWNSRIEEAATNRAKVAFADLTIAVGNAEQAFIDLNAQGFEPGSEKAMELSTALEAQIVALQKVQDLDKDELAIRDAQIARLTTYIGKLTGATAAVDSGTAATTDNTTATKDNTAAQEDNNEAVSEGQRLRNALSDSLGAIDLSETQAQTVAYANATGDTEDAITAIQGEAQQKRLNQLKDYLGQVNDATFDSEEEKAIEIADTQNKIADIELAIAKETSERNRQIAADEKAAAEDAEEQRIALAQEAAEAKVAAAEKAAEELERIEQERIAFEDALRDSATAKELRDIELTSAAYQAATDAKVAGYGKVLEAIDDQNDALVQQNAVLDLQIEKLQIQADRTAAGDDARIAGLENAGELIARLNSGEAGIVEKRLIQQQLTKLGLSDKTTELELLDAQQKAQEQLRKNENAFLEKRQQLEVLQLQNQQAQEQLALKRAVTEAQINKTKAQQLVIDQQILQLQNQIALVRAQSALDVAKSRGASPAELVALQTEVDAQTQINKLGQQGLDAAQAGVTLADEQVADAKDAVADYQKIAELQTQNLKLSQSFALGQKQAADETERLAAALERAALAGDKVKANAIVGTPEVEPKRHGGTVTPGSLYQVNEAGMEAFKPLGGKPQLLNQPANSLFSPLVPGRILTAPQVNQMLPNLNNASSGGLVGLGRLESEIRGLRSDIASRPVQVDMGASTFINEPSPLATQLQIARGRLKAARGLL